MIREKERRVETLLPSQALYINIWFNPASFSPIEIHQSSSYFGMGVLLALSLLLVLLILGGLRCGWSDCSLILRFFFFWSLAIVILFFSTLALFPPFPSFHRSSFPFTLLPFSLFFACFSSRKNAVAVLLVTGD